MSPASSAGSPIASYHALLAGSSGERLAAETHETLVAQQERRGLIFGERALCTVLRPRFFNAAQYQALARRTETLVRAFRQAHQAAMADASVRAQFRLLDWEESLLGVDAGFAEPSPTSRIDAFVVDPAGDGGTMALTEYNAETPAGAGFNDALSDAFLELPAMREFARRWHVLPMPTRHGVTASLLDAWRQFSGGRQAPRIAILDWEDVPTRREFVMFQEHFRAQGLECVIGDPTRCEYRSGGRLTLDGAPIDLIYKRVLLHELVERLGLDTPVLRAWRDRAVCLVNPPASKVLHKKASLAVLSDERNAALFDKEAQGAIAAGIPWTRVVEERQTVTAGGRVDLVMMRVVDILYSLPFIFFVIMLVVFFGRNFILMFIAVGAVEWLDMARIVRGQTLSIKRQEYVQAAEALGVETRGIIRRHVIPNTLGPVVVYMTLLVPKVILLESFLSFLGLGVQEPNTSLGVLISEGAKNIQGATWMLLYPSLTLVAILFCLNFIGDGLRDALDPKDR